MKKRQINNKVTMSSKDVQDRRTVVWLGEIPPGKENQMRYPTEEEVELSLYVMENLSEEEYDKMTEEEYKEFEREAKRIVRKKLQSEL
tara:strand:+ start:816 stop:1079 length:264 start_codon:yes stop_codon:yes gene_type:complete